MSARSDGFAGLLPALEKELDKCIRCGDCRTVCPVFREELAERYTARGKLQILRALAVGELEPQDGAREVFDNCLLCTGCADRCGSGVRADRMILAARAVFARERGLSLGKKVMGRALSQPNSALALESRVCRAFMRMLFRKVPGDSGLHRRFPLPVVDALQYVPEIAARPFRSAYRTNLPEVRETVVFFTGCMANYLMTGIAESFVAVMTALGVRVLVPAGQGCCGAPAAMSGDTAVFEKLAAANLSVLAQDGYPVVTACASCGHMLRHGYAEGLADRAEFAPLLEKLSGRVMDVSEYLYRVIGSDRIGKAVAAPTGESVAYHDPCHLAKAQHIEREPRELLAAATGVPVRELDDPRACCGLGGTYGLTHADLSKRIQARKIDDVFKTGARTVATGCPGCMLQLADGLRRQPLPGPRVRHVLDVLADALVGPDRR